MRVSAIAQLLRMRMRAALRCARLAFFEVGLVGLESAQIGAHPLHRRLCDRHILCARGGLLVGAGGGALGERAGVEGAGEGGEVVEVQRNRP